MPSPRALKPLVLLASVAAPSRAPQRKQNSCSAGRPSSQAEQSRTARSAGARGRIIPKRAVYDVGLKRRAGQVPLWWSTGGDGGGRGAGRAERCAGQRE